MRNMKFELRARCPGCKSIRTLWGYIVDADNPAALDAMERRVDQIGGVVAACPRCQSVEDVAFFFDGTQSEAWQNANEYERRNGPEGGPLPPKPWGKK